ncbi:hypothetical protein KSP40_PGU002354 [Platanthera guangdongensis]|uniref:Uncharacterized protein n=1 Tax=Platanthera guangdongensis TaxID=2320717 RepID=A0ABR2LWA9_9ASPA
MPRACRPLTFWPRRRRAFLYALPVPSGHVWFSPCCWPDWAYSCLDRIVSKISWDPINIYMDKNVYNEL